MRSRCAVPLAVALAVLSGCTGDWQRGVYEGIRLQRQVEADPASRSPAAPDYDRYRDEQIRLSRERPG